MNMTCSFQTVARLHFTKENHKNVKYKNKNHYNHKLINKLTWNYYNTYPLPK